MSPVVRWRWGVRVAAAMVCLASASAAVEPSLGERLVDAAVRRGPNESVLAETIRATLGPVRLPAQPPGPAEAQAASEREMKRYAESIAGSRVRFVMCPIPAGRFQFGSPAAEPGRGTDEGPQHEVAVDAFWMGRCEVTWNEYDTWVNALTRENDLEPPAGADAVATPSIGYVDMSLGLGRGTRPAAGMSQLAAKVYCRWLTAKTGRYYRLPTEAEWEYACRAGSTNAYSFGADPARLGDYAWFEDNSEWAAQPVGLKKPNAWGLCDMHGNLAEWVLDGYSTAGRDVAGTLLRTNPFVAPAGWDPRCVRGGSFDDPAPRLRSAARRGSADAWRQSDPNLPKSIWWVRDAPFVGFRVVRPLHPPDAEAARRYDLDVEQTENLATKRDWLRLIPTGSGPGME